MSLQLRRDTAANWTANNPTPLAGQPCFESDTNKLKIGDGVTAYNALAYISGGSVGLSAISGGTTQLTSGTASFADSNGVSFGVNGNTITATVKTDYQTSGAYLTTAMQSNAATISNINFSAGTTSQNLSKITFADSNGVSFGLNGSVVTGTVKTDYQTSGAYLTTAMQSQLTSVFRYTSADSQLQFTSANSNFQSAGAYLTSQSNQALSGANGSFTFQTASFANSNGVSFSTGTQGMFATVKTDYQSSGAYLTTAMQSNAATISNINFSAGTTSQNLSKITFADSNGISFGLNGSVVTGTVATNYQSQGAYLTTAMQSNAVTISNINFSAGTTSQNLSKITFADSNGISFGLNGSVVTGTVATNYQSQGAYLTTAMLSNAATISNINISGGTTSQNLSKFVFADAGGVSFGLNGSTLTASAGVPNPYISSFQNMPAVINSSLLTFGMRSLSHAAAFNMPEQGSFSFLRIPVLMTTNSTTVATLASATATASNALYSTLNAVIYSLGTGASSQSLQSVVSGSAGFTFSQNISITNSTQYSVSQGISQYALGAQTTLSTQYSISNTNYSFTTNQIATNFSTARFIDIPFANSLSAGPYWLILGGSSSSASGGAVAGMSNCNVRYSGHYGASQLNVGFGIMGSTNLASGGQLGNGFFSTAGGGTTASLNISAISSTASNPVPWFALLRSA